MAYMVTRFGGVAIMSVTISISDQDIFTALRTFLISVLPSGTEVVQAQDNSVPMPLGAFVAMNNVGLSRLSTNTDTYIDPVTTTGTKNVSSDIEYTIQLDFYGASAADWAMIVQTLFRDEYGVSLFPSNVVPLYADDPIQIALIDGEQQYEQRWVVKAVMQYNPVVSTPQDFAAQLEIGLKNVDAVYPP
jgi:hypothetical protein